MQHSNICLKKFKWCLENIENMAYYILIIRIGGKNNDKSYSLE